MFDSTNTYAFFDLVALGLLPNDWEKELKDFAEQYSYLIHLDGKSSTSRESKNSKGADVYVADGNQICINIPWLHSLYEYELLAFANKTFNNEYEIAKDIKSCTNINLLKGKGARYEWHVDSNPLTGLLFVTNHNENEGGELVFKKEGKMINVYPKPGIFILFDAREVPHYVAPLKNDKIRISVPMNYYFKGDFQERPSDLDSYIY
jgi:hypothetical protein